MHCSIILLHCSTKRPAFKMATRRCKACGKKRTPGERFHRFPVSNPELCRKWIINAKLPDFLPTENDILCADHFDANAYKYPGAQRLDDNAVPTIFVHTQTIERKLPMKRPLPVVVNNDDDEKPAKLIHVDSSPTKDELKVVIIKQDTELNKKRKEIKTLKQKVRRKEAKVTTLQNLIKDIKKKGLLAPSIADCLSENFEGLTGELISNHFSNINRNRNGVRYVDDVKKFALTLHFYIFTVLVRMSMFEKYSVSLTQGPYALGPHPYDANLASLTTFSNI